MRNRWIKQVFSVVAFLLLAPWPIAYVHTYYIDATERATKTAITSNLSDIRELSHCRYPFLYDRTAVSSENADSSSRAMVLKTPTFEEVKDFIIRDPTNCNEFVLNQYECRHFAAEVNNNAETAGLRCAFVLLCFERGQHAVVAFDTTDRGLVYIEPQSDAAIHPEVGSEYQGKEIKEILIIW